LTQPKNVDINQSLGEIPASFKFDRPNRRIGMSELQGRFVWYELLATDTGAAKGFYTKVVGWATQPGPASGMDYTLFTAAELPAAGLMLQPEDARKMGAPPSWIGYVAVDDVDTTTEQVKRLGGTVHVPPCDIPNVGRFSVLADPQKAVFALFKSSQTCEVQPPEPDAAGHIGWHELLAADWEKAFGFYSELFGWQKSDAMPMGEMGTYQMFSVGGQAIGGMFTTSRQQYRPLIGSTISMSATSMRRSSACGRAAARSSTVRWRCRAATGSSRAGTRRARCSHWWERGPDRPIGHRARGRLGFQSPHRLAETG
jgi:uncharacterized protein